MNVSIDNAVTTFLAKVNKGPDYVCTSCHRMMYKENIVCNKSKYTKASNELLDQVFCAGHSYISNAGKLWICKACDNALSHGNIPVQAKANNLQLNEKLRPP